MWIEADVARLEAEVATCKEDNHQQDMLASNFETCIRINKEQGETISELQDQIKQGNVDADAVEGGQCDCKNQDDFIGKLQMGIKEFADQRDKCQEMLSEVIDCEEMPVPFQNPYIVYCHFSIIQIIGSTLLDCTIRAANLTRIWELIPIMIRIASTYENQLLLLNHSNCNGCNQVWSLQTENKLPPCTIKSQHFNFYL